MPRWVREGWEEMRSYHRRECEEGAVRLEVNNHVYETGKVMINEVMIVFELEIASKIGKLVITAIKT